MNLPPDNQWTGDNLDEIKPGVDIKEFELQSYPLERFGLALMALRHRRCLSRQQVAERCGLETEVLLSLELGEATFSQTLAALACLAPALAVPKTALFEVFETSFSAEE